MRKEDLKILFDSNKIRLKVEELGNQITNDYKTKKTVLVGVLDGALVFLSDLIRSINTRIEIDFIKISSYRKGTSNDNLILVQDLSSNIENKDVIIVEDIIDTGISVEFLKNRLSKMSPNSLKICTFINKTGRRKVDINIDYIGFDIEHGFIVGYGMDYNKFGRNFPDIYILTKG